MRCLRAGFLGVLTNLPLSTSFHTPVIWRRTGHAAHTKVYSSGSGSSGGSTPGEAKAANKIVVSGAASQESEAFDWLASNAGIRAKSVSLGITSGGYRGLLANEDVQEGQVSWCVW